MGLPVNFSIFSMQNMDIQGRCAWGRYFLFPKIFQTLLIQPKTQLFPPIASQFSKKVEIRSTLINKDMTIIF